MAEPTKEVRPGVRPRKQKMAAKFPLVPEVDLTPGGLVSPNVCCFCGEEPPVVNCLSCVCLWCEPCFEKVHGVSSVFMKHDKVLLRTSRDQNNISILKSEDASVPGSPKRKQDKKVTIELLNETLEHQKIGSEKLASQYQNLGKQKADLERSLVQAREDIMQCMKMLDTALQARKEELMNHLEAEGLQRASSLDLERDEMEKALSDHEQALSKALKLVVMMDQSGDSAGADAVEVLRYMQGFDSLKICSSEMKSCEIKCFLDTKSLLECINKFGTIESLSFDGSSILGSSVEVGSRSPLDSDVPKPNCLAIEEDPTSQNRMLDECLEKGDSQASPETPFPKLNVWTIEGDPILENTPQPAVLCHAVRPDLLFVRFVQANLQYKVLQDMIKDTCLSVSVLPPKEVTVGHMIFAWCNTLKAWSRATVVCVVPFTTYGELEDECKTRQKSTKCLEDVSSISLFFLDSGFEETCLIKPQIDSEQEEVPGVNTVKCLQSILRKPPGHEEQPLFSIPPLAFKCELKDLVPNPPGEWSEEICQELRRLCMDRSRSISVLCLGRCDEKLQVDLLLPPPSALKGALPTSISAAFVSCGFACVCSSEATNDAVKDIAQLKFYPPDTLPMNELILVTVSFMESPSYFSVRQGGVYLRYLKSLMSALQYVYSSSTGPSWEVFCPTPNTPCVAQFNGGLWCRAFIKAVSKQHVARIRFVDFGNEESVQVSNLRQMSPKFLILPAQAVNCALTDVIPADGNAEWSDEARTQFATVATGKECWCLVKGTGSEGQALVILWEMLKSDGQPPLTLDEDGDDDEEQEGSINKMLVLLSLACKTFPGCNNALPERRVVESSPAAGTLASSKNSIIRLLNGAGFIDRHNHKIQVNVSYVVSPSEIYLQAATSFNKHLYLLQQNLADVCDSHGQPHEKLNYKRGSLCAFEDKSFRRWFRCHVVDTNLGNGKVQIQYIDYGTKKWVNVSQLHELGEWHMLLPPQAVACRLAGIKPAGGTNKWTATANDFTRYNLTGQTCFAIMKGVVNMHSGKPTQGAVWLVDLFVNEDDAKQISFAYQLVQEGLAFSTTTDNSEWLVPPMTLTNLVSGEAKQSWTSSSYPPPISPPSLSFSMLVTSIDKDCYIFGRPIGVEKALASLMDLVQISIVELELDIPKSRGMDEFNWQPNQACLVHFSDGGWHRAFIIHILSGAVRIQYVDIGASEDIPSSHLIITNLFTDIPPLCLKISLCEDLVKRNLWPERAEAYLHHLLVGKIVDVSLQSLSAGDEGSLLAKVWHAGLSISHLLAHRHLLDAGVLECEGSDIECPASEVHHESQDLEIVVLSQFSKLFQMDDYLPMELPVLGEAFYVSVSHIDLPNQLFVRHFGEREFKISDDVSLNESPDSSLSELNRKLHQIDVEAFTIPLLDDWEPGMPCLAQYMCDDCWYRGRIVSLRSKCPLSALVQFVDYGVTQVLSQQRVRKLPPLLLLIPLCAVQCHLHGVHPPTNVSPDELRLTYQPKWPQAALTMLVSALSGRRITAVIKEKQPEVVVSLFEEMEDGCLTSVVKRLMDEGLVERNKSLLDDIFPALVVVKPQEN
uniref:RING finger protein 17-like n=1 Tax=Myxine glutinosa TaxID=7769 RepID=UPI00358F3E1E